MSFEPSVWPWIQTIANQMLGHVQKYTFAHLRLCQLPDKQQVISKHISELKLVNTFVECLGELISSVFRHICYLTSYRRLVQIVLKSCWSNNFG
jgi:hypothetical protein